MNRPPAWAFTDPLERRLMEKLEEEEREMRELATSLTYSAQLSPDELRKVGWFILRTLDEPTPTEVIVNQRARAFGLLEENAPAPPPA